jgi:hypothetical protein
MRVIGNKKTREWRTIRYIGTAAIILFASLVSTHGQDQSAQQRARILEAIEAYRGVQQKFEQSRGSLAGFAGFYSRGYRCEYNEKTAGRPPGLWEKTQFALWFDEKSLYGMQLDSSPAVFQFEYRFLQNVIGTDMYQMTRVDHLGSAAGIDDSEWRIVGFGIPNPQDVTRIGIHIPADFFTHPDVHAISPLTTCGRGGPDKVFIDPTDPLDVALRILQRRLATTPSP